MKRALVILAACTGLAACGGGGSGSPHVAALGTLPAASHTATTLKPNRQDAIRLYSAWAACMRQHGIQMQDPTIDDKGHANINITGGSLGVPGPNGAPDQAFQTANTACDALHEQARQAAGEGPTTKPDPAAMLRYSRCMRAHGLPDFPDPTAGGLRIQVSGNSDLSPDSPAFQKAQLACQDNLPNHGQGGERITAGNGAGPGGPGGPAKPGGSSGSGASTGLPG